MSDTANTTGNNTETRRRVGDLLRDERILRDEDLKDVAKNLAIRLPFMEAIENSEPHNLPGSAYALGFVRSYAEYLGMDSKKMVEQYKLEAKELEQAIQLNFPEPLPTRGIPIGALLFIGVLLAALFYGTWWYLNNQGKQFSDLVPALNQEESNQVASADTTETMETTETSSEEALEEIAETATAAVEQAVEETVETVSEAVEEVAEDATQAVETATTEIAEEAENILVRADTVEADATQAATTVTEEISTTTEAATEAVAETANTTVEEVATATEAVTENTETATSEVAEAAATETATEEITETVETETTEAIEAATETAENVIEADPTTVEEVTDTTTPEVTEPVTEVATTTPEEATEEITGRVYGTEHAGSRVTLKAIESAWVEVTKADGELALTRLLRKGDSFRVPNEQGMTMVTGNAGGIMVILDGKELGATGEIGAVRRDLLLDAENLDQRVN